MMQVKIKSSMKFAHIAPRKVRPLLRDLKFLHPDAAIAKLNFMPQKGAALLAKLIKTVKSDALNNHSLPESDLKILSLAVNDGPRQKRYWLRSHGKADIKLKRQSHLEVTLVGEKKDDVKKKKVTKAELAQKVRAVGAPKRARAAKGAKGSQTGKMASNKI